MPNLIDSTLSEVCTLVTDGTHDTPKRVENGFPLIKAKEIVGGEIDFEECDQISEEEHLRVISRSKPEYGDTLFAHIGASLGEAAFVNTRRQFSIKNIALFKPNPNVLDGRYLFYLVISPLFQAMAKSAKTGSAQPFLSLGHLRSHRIKLHGDLRIQRKIASVLSAYDDLMENNRRRIAILEEMAQRLYREWFVEFRFPGPENLKLVDSPLGKIPEGWEVLPIKRLGGKVVLGGTPARKNPSYWNNGTIPWLKSGKLNELRVMDGTEFISERGLRESATKIMPPKTVLIAITGAILISFLEIEACANQSVAGIFSIEKCSPEYLHLYLLENIWLFESKMSGSAQQHINKSIVENTPVLVPPPKLTSQFAQFIEPNYGEVESLLRKNAILRTTRDLLLPKLISGEVDVSELDIQLDDAA